VNAAQRYLEASTARDVQAALAELAEDVAMLSPATDDAVVGRDAVASALRAVEAACDEFRHAHLLRSGPNDQSALYGLVFEARVGDARLSGVDLIELDDHDQICRFTVMARPMASLMALGARIADARPSGD
jgi:hypothetical protein